MNKRKKMAHRRLITLVVASLVVVIGLNIVWARRDDAAQMSIGRAVELEVKNLNSRTNYANLAIDIIK